MSYQADDYYGEQPEDALRRYLHDDTGLHIEQSKLFDVVTGIDHDDRDIQYAVITILVTLAEGHHDLRLGSNYDEYLWFRCWKFNKVLLQT